MAASEGWWGNIHVPAPIGMTCRDVPWISLEQADHHVSLLPLLSTHPLRPRSFWVYPPFLPVTSPALAVLCWYSSHPLYRRGMECLAVQPADLSTPAWLRYSHLSNQTWLSSPAPAHNFSPHMPTVWRARPCWTDPTARQLCPAQLSQFSMES